MAGYDKLVVVTRKTALEELIERFNTRDQARFYIEHMGGDFAEYHAAHDAYVASKEGLRLQLPRDVRAHWIDRLFLPTFKFGDHVVVVVLGQDGLVVNTAKYLNGQPLVAFNPDPVRIDGVLLPFQVDDAGRVLGSVLQGRESRDRVTMAQATLNDGQTLLAVNDLFIGAKTHVSARYVLTQGEFEETQSSSGIIVSTGAGSTGWHRSIVTGAAEIVDRIGGLRAARALRDQYRFDWCERRLVYAAREPFVSKTSQAEMIYGEILDDSPLTITSRMPQNGVIFSDGVEEDRLDFNSGAVATVGLAERVLNLVTAG